MYLIRDRGKHRSSRPIRYSRKCKTKIKSKRTWAELCVRLCCIVLSLTFLYLPMKWRSLMLYVFNSVDGGNDCCMPLGDFIDSRVGHNYL